MQKQKGSITIFSLLSLLLITAFLFGLLEGTRFQELRRFAKLQTENAVESVFANYNTSLWKSYRLLGTSSNHINAILEIAANGRSGEGTNFLRLEPIAISVTGDTRLTDGDGAVFVASVAAYMKENFAYEMAKEVYSQYEAINQLLEQNQMDLSSITEALNLQKTEQRARTRGQDVWTILEEAAQWMKSGILQLVIQDTNTLSEQKLDTTNDLFHRKRMTGINTVEYSANWSDRILLQQYLMMYLSSYYEKVQNRALSYELEYLIGKKSSDIENLNITAGKLLTIREAANFVYLLSNTACVAQAETMALLLVGATANPVLVEIVKMGLLTAWALAESILDVRALMAGKRIALLKSEETWTTELENLSGLSDGFPMAKECNCGLTYQDYLGLLLLFEEEESLAMHSMNLQEATIRKTDGDSSFGIDQLLTELSVSITYSYEPVFPFLREIDAEERWERRLSTSWEYGYYRKAGIKG